MKKALIGLGVASLLTFGVGSGLTISQVQNKPVEAKAHPITAETTYYVDLKNVDNWKELTQLNIYAFDSTESATLGAWPGSGRATISDGIATCTLPKDTDCFILNNVSEQTVNIHVCDIININYTLDGSKDGSGHYTGSWGDISGWYLVGTMNEWGHTAKDYKSGALGATGNNGIWTNVSLEKDSEFKLRYFQDFYFKDDDNPWKSWDDLADYVSSSTTDYFRIANEGMGEQNIHCKFTGTYNITLNSSYKIELQPTDTTVVSKFVSDYIGEDGHALDASAASCEAKYNATHDAYEALSPSQKSLFTSNASFKKYYDMYQYWNEHKNDSVTAKVVSEMTRTPETLVISIVLIAAASIALVSFFVIRKSKQN